MQGNSYIYADFGGEFWGFWGRGEGGMGFGGFGGVLGLGREGEVETRPPFGAVGKGESGKNVHV